MKLPGSDVHSSVHSCFVLILGVYSTRDNYSRHFTLNFNRKTSDLKEQKCKYHIYLCKKLLVHREIVFFFLKDNALLHN